MNQRRIYDFSAIFEIASGLAMAVAPGLSMHLLLGEIDGDLDHTIVRILGLALISLGIASWQPGGTQARLTQRVGLCAYNIGVGSVLLFATLSANLSGMLLWPALGLHLLLGLIMLVMIASRAKKVP